MKKFIKIFSVVLTLALISGALVIASAAAVEGETTQLNVDFNFTNFTEGLLVDGAASANVTNLDGLTASTFRGRFGSAYGVIGSDDNQYVKFEATSKAVSTTTGYHTGGTYVYYALPGNSTRPTATNPISANDISTVKFYSAEFDIMSPTGSFMAGNVDLSARAVLLSGTSPSVTFWTTNATSYPVYFKNDATTGAPYLESFGVKKYINPYEFTRVQIIVENTTEEGDDNIGLTTYVYVNGELFASKVASNVPTNYYTDLDPHATFVEYKFNFDYKYSSTEDASKTTAFDNIVWRTVAAGSAATAEDLVKSTDDIPAGITVATLNDVPYEDLSKAIADAEEGDTITLTNNVTHPVLVDKTVSIVAGEYTANLVAPDDTYYFDIVDGVYTLTAKTPQFEYVKGGVTTTVYAQDGVALNTVFANADADTTIKLLSDCIYDGSTIALGRNLTLDLNGYTLDSTLDAKKRNSGLFSVGVKDRVFTITSSREGGKIFSASTKNDKDVSSTTSGDPVVSVSSGGVLYIYGADAQGNTTVSMYAATIVQAWSSAATVYIDGGEYYRTRSDNTGFIQLQGDFDLTMKNALVHGFSSGALLYLEGRGRTAGLTSNAVIDNSTIIAYSDATNISPNTFAEVNVLFTNCYLRGSLKPTTVRSGLTAGGVWTLGVGNYISGDLSDNVVLADGTYLINEDTSKAIVEYYNTYSSTNDVFNASSFTINTYNLTMTFDKRTVDESAAPVTVIFKDTDGTVIGTLTALRGQTVETPYDQFVENGAIYVMVEGWVNGVPNEWDASLTIPESLVGNEYVLTAVEDGALLPYEATTEILFNISTQVHNKINFYVPTETPEGVIIRSAYIGTTKRFEADENGNTTYNWSSNGLTSTINGQKYGVMATWPGVHTAATSSWTAEVTITYQGQTLTKTAKTDMASYCNTVLNSNAYGEQAKTVVVNIANYLVACTDLRSATYTTVTNNLKTIVTNNTSRIVTPSAEELVLPDTTAMSVYVKNIQLGINATAPYFLVNLTDAGKTAYEVNLGGIKRATDATTVQTGNWNVSALRSVNLKVTVTEGGEVVSLTYTLANYCKALEGQTGEDVALALYGYAFAQKAYEDAKK